MKILLTGPTGFIGSAFTRLALSHGHEVAGLLVPSENLPAHLPEHPRLHWLRGTLDQAPWPEIAAFQPDACLHLAWITTPGVYLESPENERFRDTSLRFMRQLPSLGARYLFGIGTCVEYQITDQPLSEEHTPLAPTTAYARAKNELRLGLEAEAKTQGFEFCWGRIFYPYGPGEHPSRLCSAILQKLARGEAISLKTPQSTKDYIFIEDLAAALLQVLERRFCGPVNLGTGIGVSVRELARHLGQLLGRPELVTEAEPPQADPFPFVVADATRLRSLGWQPALNLEEGLKRLVQTAGAAGR